jgi:hypothetical protein
VTILEYLRSDHERLEALLAQATAQSGQVSRPEFAAFRGGLLRHIGLEEKLLIPALKKLRSEPHPQALRLRRDHGAITSLLVPTPTPEIVAALRAVLGPHNLAEEKAGGIYGDAADLPDAEVLLERMRAVKEPPQSPYNDGPAAFRQIEHTMTAAGIAHPPPGPPVSGGGRSAG